MAHTILVDVDAIFSEIENTTYTPATMPSEEDVARIIARAFGQSGETGIEWDQCISAARLLKREFQIISP